MSGQDDDEYARARPAVAARLRAVGLDVAYVRARGDVLTRDDGRDVLDLAGGFGTTLLGHNHPRLVAALKAALDEQRPFSSQMSWRTEAARLSCALSARIARDLGHAPRVLLYSTGAEAVEAAVTWALLEYRARWREVAPGAPVLLGVEGGYHGRSAGAASVSARLAGDLGARALQAEVRFCPRDDEATLARWCDELTVDGRCRVAAIIVEPIQGEGGVVPLAHGFLAAMRRLADAHGFVLIADEIQCGLGRTGSFLASSGTGLAPDAVLLGKALGGSLVKLAALAVREQRFVESLPLVATGTFVDDDLSARVGMAALQLLDDEDVPGRCATVGAAFGAGLRELAGRHPSVVRGVRGRGLMLGLELGVADLDGGANPLLSLLADAGFLAAAVAGYLVQQHGIRTAPAMSALSVLRMQPSAFFTDADIERTVAALDDALAVLERGDVALLLQHVSGEQPRAASNARARARPRVQPSPNDARVAFLAPLAVAGDLRHLEPALAELSDAACERLLDRAGPLLPPLHAGTARVTSTTGAVVHLEVVGVPMTAAQAMAALRDGRPDAVTARVRAAAALGVESGARVVGFGGHTSIVGQLDTSWSGETSWISGNALTAAAAAEVARAGARRRGWPLKLGVVGGAGSIGALVAELLAADAEEIVLVGRPRSAARLEAVAQRALGGCRWRVASEPRELASCTVVVCASNAPEPLLLAEHVGRPALVVDVAVPGDAHPELGHLQGVTVLRGGAVRLPGSQTLGIAGLDLGGGHVHACLAETLLCGLGALYDTALAGSPSAARARRLLALAGEHGFVIDEAPR
ncbi:MAG: aminotransferase class III-fold pyridoxal phosphate-dependent enzyme [Deltaproteobacteria bacterium]|nr:aminotransferase class III-fold pyridoxal phosphate-dependent enzyme [Deltaproteobacteria bacterium]